MNYNHLYLSAKFAAYLLHKGMLDPLTLAYQEFLERQNFPFELKEKRIAVQAVFKGLCELYASRGFKEEDLISLGKERKNRKFSINSENN